MKNKEVIIIPVGTDLITLYTNIGQRLLGSDYEEISTIVDNLSEIPIYSNTIINRNNSQYESEIKRLKLVLSRLWVEDMEYNSCIELATIFNIEKLKMDDGVNDVEIILIIKDNLLELICSELICEFLTQKNLTIRLEYPCVGNSKYILRGYSKNTELDSKNGICSLINMIRDLPTEQIGVIFGDVTDLRYNTVVFTQYTNQWVLLEALSCQVKSRRTIVYPDGTMTQNR